MLSQNNYVRVVITALLYVFYPAVAIVWCVVCRRNHERGAYWFLVYALLGLIGLVGFGSMLFERGYDSRLAAQLIPVYSLMYLGGIWFLTRNITRRSGISVVRNL